MRLSVTLYISYISPVFHYVNASKMHRAVFHIVQTHSLHEHTLCVKDRVYLPNRASIEQVIVVFTVFSIYTINHSVVNNINCIRNTDNKGKFYAITRREDTQKV
jgi:hypothetical protein